MLNSNQTMIDYISITGENKMFSAQETITIDGVKYKKVEDTKMTVKETATAKTVVYKDKTYLRVEQSNYMGSTDWWEMYGTNYMNKVSDVALKQELDREHTNQFNVLNISDIFTLNNPYPKGYPYNEGGSGTYSFNTK